MSKVKEVFEKMPAAFKPEAAKGVDAIFQYEIEGEEGGNWHVIIKDGTCEVKEGIHDSPSVTLKMSDETFLAMQASTINGMQAYMTGKLKVTGNIMLAQTFPNLFKTS